MSTNITEVPFNNRILIIDDNPAIHDDFRKVLGSGRSESRRDLEDDEDAIFGKPQRKSPGADFDLASAYQGQEGLEAVRAAAREGRPFAMAFVDIRMPPGWDGIETITAIWKEFPDLQIVICTAYSDYSWDDMANALGSSDSVLVLKKPFDTVEVLQMAHALTKKWQLTRLAHRRVEDMDRLVNQRTAELRVANEQLKSEVAERTAAETALRQSEERFSKAFQASPVPMAIQHLGRKVFIDVNRSFLALTGRAREELLNCGEAVGAIWAEESTAALVTGLMDGDAPVREHAVGILNKNGERRDGLLYTEKVELGGETHLLLIVQDTTEHMRMENQLRQAQKMEAVGRLAAGIAHDFNNILTVIIGNTSLQLANPQINDTLSKALTQVVKAADRATELTRQLLAYSRKQIIQKRDVDLNETVTQASAMLRRVIGEHITIATDLAPGLPAILADATNVDQVIMNIVLNARDAMPEGGRLTISTAKVNVTATQAALCADAREGRFVRLALRDTGCGMDAATLGRIFEPFFTTKEIGRGTGMGLATTFGIVKQHGGWIEVESELGRGTTFRIYFPIADVAQAVEPVPAADPAQGLAPKGGTILVVEDEDMLRLFVTEVLESFGYKVLSAANGAQALEIWEREKENIDLLLTDVVMPESISGRQLARLLQQDNHQLKVIYTSGYSAELIGSEFETERDHAFLPKPYHSERLTALVSTCLSSELARSTAAPAGAR
jgi:PAS domain S-box-containing protein